MKILLTLLFITLMAGVSAYFGLDVTKEPIRYVLVNTPVIALFMVAINLK